MPSENAATSRGLKAHGTAGFRLFLGIAVAGYCLSLLFDRSPAALFWGGLLILAAVVVLFGQRASISDSPWFWVSIFSMSATIALYVMDAKYNHRQTHIEDQYRYGTKTLRNNSPTQNDKPSSVSSTGSPTTVSPLTEGPQPQTHELLVSLQPLRIIAIAVMAVSWIALQIEFIKRSGRSATKPAEQTVA